MVATSLVLRRVGRAAVAASALLIAGAALADAPRAATPSAPAERPGERLYLEISPDGLGEVQSLLDALDATIVDLVDDPQPVIVILHGPEARTFTRSQYLANRALLDQAARLDALDVVRFRMCETWMRSNGIDATALLPFVETVPFAPEEIERLQRRGFRPVEPPTI